MFSYSVQNIEMHNSLSVRPRSERPLCDNDFNLFILYRLSHLSVKGNLQNMYRSLTLKIESCRELSDMAYNRVLLAGWFQWIILTGVTISSNEIGECVCSGLRGKSAKFEELSPKKRHTLLGEFWFFLKHNKKWWLLPIILVLLVLLFLSLIILLSGTAIAPFIYPFF